MNPPCVIPNLLLHEYLKAPGIDQSGLKILGRSPAHYRYYRDHPEPSTPAQILGTILHYAVFQPELLNGSHHVKPLTYTDRQGKDKKWNANAEACKQWLDDHSNRPVISLSNYKWIEGMAKSIFQHPAAALALTEGQAERSMFVEDPETGLLIKCRTDWQSGNAVVDLKKCQDASKDGFAKTIGNYGYDLQAAMNLHICALLKQKQKAFLFIAVEEEPPHAVGVYQLTEEDLRIGESKRKRLMMRYAECEAADEWPGYSRNVEYITLPTYARRAEFNAVAREENPAEPAYRIE